MAFEISLPYATDALAPHISKETLEFHFGKHHQGYVNKLNAAVDEEARYALMGEAQKMIAEDSVNGFLFQLAKHGVWNANVKGLWENSPVQANDLTEVYWE